jgi:hypothetical protein
VEPTFGGEDGGLEVEIWRGLKNRGSFGGPAGVVFFTKPPKFGVEAHI